MNFFSFKKNTTIKCRGEMALEDLEKLNTKKEIYEFFLPEPIIPELLYWVGPSPILHLPSNMMVMPGGHKYSRDEHPFMMALEVGMDSLEEFYAYFSPLNLVEMYGIKREGLLGEDLPPWELPWLLRKRVLPSSEGGLGSEHGVSFFGPASPEKVTLEMKRLNSVRESISRKGYRPKLTGHIEGFFLRSGDKYRFFVLGGKHRAAVLGLMNDGRVPVRMRASGPRVVDRGDSSNWPLVRNKSISEELALKVFDAYFDTIPSSERIALAR